MAKEHQNPYNFTRPVTEPEVFAGRQRELYQIEYCLDLSANRRPIYMNLALIGQRTAGKTSLLNRVKFMAEQKDFLALKINLDNSVVSSDINFFFEVYNGLMTVGCQRGMFGGLDGHIYLTFRQAIDLLTLDVDMAHMPLLFPTTYIGSMNRQRTDLPVSQHVLVHDFEQLRLEARSNDMQTIVILFDECDLFSTNETLLQKLRNLFSEVEGYVLIFAGTERMFPRLQEVFSPIPRQFKKISVENFRKFAEVRECILKPLLPEEKNLVGLETLRELNRLSGGSPYEVNLVCHFMYRRYELGEADGLTMSRDVLDDVRAELDRLRDIDRKSIIPTVRQLSRDELQFLSKVLPFEKLTIDEIMIYEQVGNALLQEPSGQVDLSEWWNRLQACTEKGLVELDDDTGQISFCGDEFDRLYIKYHIRSMYAPDELEWHWRDESLVELVSDLFSTYLTPAVNQVAYYGDYSLHSPGEKMAVRRFYKDEISLAFEDTEYKGKQLRVPTMDVLLESLLPVHVFVQEAILQLEGMSSRRVLGAVVEVMRRGEIAGDYHFISLRPEVSLSSAVEILQLSVSSGNERLKPYEIEIRLGKTELMESDVILSVDALKALAASVGEDRSMSLRYGVEVAGKEFYKLGLLAEAYDTFVLGMQIWPEWGFAYNNAGFILMEVDDYAQATCYLCQALESDLECSAFPHLNLGYIQFLSGEYQEALDHFLQAKQTLAEEPWVGKAWLRIGYYPKEFSSVLDLREEKAPLIDPVSAVYANLCAVYLALGRTDNALAICEEGLERNPTDYYVLAAKASALFHSGDASGVLKTLEEISDLSSPGDVKVGQLMEMIHRIL